MDSLTTVDMFPLLAEQPETSWWRLECHSAGMRPEKIRLRARDEEHVKALVDHLTVGVWRARNIQKEAR